jgi:hypothetical protein
MTQVDYSIFDNLRSPFTITVEGVTRIVTIEDVSRTITVEDVKREVKTQS